MNDDFAPLIALLCPSGYEIINLNRPSRGGGICFIHKNHYDVKNIESMCLPYIEFMVLKVKTNKMILTVIIVYRIPGTNFLLFLEKFTELLSEYTVDNANVLIVGDFNVPINKKDSNSGRLLSLFYEYGIQNFTMAPTHRNGNILDLIASTMDLSDIRIEDVGFSDHFYWNSVCLFVLLLIRRSIQKQLNFGIKSNGSN